jgi:hypothetical protein
MARSRIPNGSKNVEIFPDYLIRTLRQSFFRLSSTHLATSFECFLEQAMPSSQPRAAAVLVRVDVDGAIVGGSLRVLQRKDEFVVGPQAICTRDNEQHWRDSNACLETRNFPCMQCD